MKALQNTFDHLFYEYNPQEFFPILYEGKLMNKSAFARYKAKCVVKSLARLSR